jgi:hypothetical protein
MSQYNLLLLARKLRKEEEKPIFYKNRKSSWKTIFKKHPLESKANEALFQKMVHCKENFGLDDGYGEVTLRSAYTWSILTQIAEKSLKDCATFYEIAQHTLFHHDFIVKQSINNWFKKSLTALYLSNSNAPEELNYLSTFNQEQKEASLSKAFQYSGIKTLPQYEALKSEFNIKNFNEKLIFWYWEADNQDNNYVDKVIEKLGEKKPLEYNLEYIAENFKPNNLLKNQSLEIDKRFIPFSDINVLTKRYAIKTEKNYCQINEETDKIPLSVIFNLFCCQTLLRTIIERQIKQSPGTNSVGQKLPASFLGEISQEDTMEAFDTWPIAKEARSSMQNFIEMNKASANNFKGSQAADLNEFWGKVQSAFSTKILNEDLELKSDKIKKNKNKI